MSGPVSISTHVLDAAGGGPRVGVTVTVEDAAGDEVATARTDADGRIAPLAEGLTPGHYTVRWRCGGALTTAVAITFHLEDDRHYHLPLLTSDVTAVSYLGV